ncbi:Ig-like domain-containing protein [Phaeobacter gallaeciensis]|uniref:Ig-like domain-containing protein n=1 Tax=Phaeobacter gallaeciensis TaxID=60890 RepID=UPI00237EF5EB|nr:Ig-like domain-containing protein [Phaeobacter gallaeciensis]MDE4063682.1 Ig-like domain-containing protein [Phaeobacter gallaeciensis]MDE4126701.1 Ig-like domain-containing protein [Phaeobacter gallaeciensis]MDE4131178.1 Ig-like domain-containing protein [Phaeobacter gallaeciensis]
MTINSMLFASYETLDLSGKWSAYDELVFLDVDRIEPVIAPLAAPLLGGFGAAGVAAAGVVGTSVLVTDDSETGTTPPGRGRVPTVDDPDAVYPIAGSTNDPVVITGTGTPGSEVRVLIGGHTETVTIRDDGTWTATIAVTDLPPDGNYDTTVEVTDPDGNDFDLDGPTVIIDTTPPEAEVTSGTQSVGDIVNAVEQADGPVITGTGEPGARLNVRINNVTQRTKINDDGTWSVTFDPADIPTGEYETEVQIITTDEFGNRNTYQDVLKVDTETAVTIDPRQAGGDNIVNAAEAEADVTLTGVAEPGADVAVTLAGVTRDALVDASGNWSATFEPGAIPPGEYDSAVTVAATDIAGNTASASSALRVDTVAGTVTISPDPVELDDIINATERADGVEISGTATPGLLVTVGLGTASNQVVADVNGNWSTTFLAGQIPQGNAELPITASIVDSVGNTVSATDTVVLDMLVDSLTVAPNQTPDDIINVAERAAGVTLQGTVEQGSTVQVTIAGVTHAATVDAAGYWSADIAAADLPEGDYTATATITATDPAGNVQSLTESFAVDTSYTTPDVDAVTFSSSDVRRISTEGVTDSYTVDALNNDGSVTAPTASVDQDPVFGTEFTFSTPVSDGTHLVITSEDSAQNASSTLVVLEDNASNSGALDHAGLPQFNIDALNLDYASDVSLSLTEADIKALSGNSDTLTVHGGADDTLTVANASAAGVEAVDGQIYNVYTVGDDGTKLLVDQDVNVLI